MVGELPLKIPLIASRDTYTVGCVNDREQGHSLPLSS